jgi:hypothetical protein
MMASLYQWLFNSSGNELLLNFKAGYTTGVVVVLLLLVALKLFHSVFFGHGSRVKEVVIPNSKGDLIISSQAIADMIDSLVASKFKHITIAKVVLRKVKNGVVMDIFGDFHLDGGSLPNTADELREEIFKNMDERLGISSIRKIFPHIRKAPSTRNTFA